MLIFFDQIENKENQGGGNNTILPLTAALEILHARIRKYKQFYS